MGTPQGFGNYKEGARVFRGSTLSLALGLVLVTSSTLTVNGRVAAQTEDREIPDERGPNGEIRGAEPPPRVKIAQREPPAYQRVDLSYEYRRGSIWVKIQPGRNIDELMRKHALAGPATQLHLPPFNPRARAIGLDRWYRVGVDPGTEKDTVLRLSPRYTQVAADDFVYVHVEWQFPGEATLTPNDPQFATYQAGYIDAIKLRQAWDLHVSHPGTSQVAIIDSGYLGSHEDAAVWKQSTGHDYLTGLSLAPGAGTEYYNGRICFAHGHGTLVGTIAAGETNNAKGIAASGFNSGIMIFRTLANTSGSNCVWAALQEHRGWSVRTAADRGADVINMSYTFGAAPGGLLGFEEESIAYAWSMGAMPIAAAGNGGTNVPWYPCAYDYVICAGASFNDGSRCTAPSCSDSGSNYGTHVDFAVPGYLLRGAGGLSTTDYTSASATSFAAPLLSGVAAILHAAGKTTPLSKYTALYYTTQNNLGWTSRGLIDAYAAVLY